MIQFRDKFIIQHKRYCIMLYHKLHVQFYSRFNLVTVDYLFLTQGLSQADVGYALTSLHNGVTHDEGIRNILTNDMAIESCFSDQITQLNYCKDWQTLTTNNRTISSNTI